MCAPVDRAMVVISTNALSRRPSPAAARASREPALRERGLHLKVAGGAGSGLVVADVREILGKSERACTANIDPAAASYCVMLLLLGT
jgi:hypothetical protein